MSLQYFFPRKPLSDYVQLIWSWEGYHPPHSHERILPLGTTEITINLSDRNFEVFSPRNGLQSQTIQGAMVMGVQSDYFVIDTSHPADLLSVWFKPGGAIPFFGLPAQELQNLHVDLATLWGQDAVDLYHQLLEAPSTQQRFHRLEHALCQRLSQAPIRHPAVDYALHLFRSSPQASIANVLDDIALSPTRFIQVFREEVGLTPKLFCRIQRFQQALFLIANQQMESWVDVALSCGYYDQSHFINDFQTFAGIAPSAYAPQSREHYTNLPEVAL